MPLPPPPAEEPAAAAAPTPAELPRFGCVLCGIVAMTSRARQEHHEANSKRHKRAAEAVAAAAEAVASRDGVAPAESAARAARLQHEGITAPVGRRGRSLGSGSDGGGRSPSVASSSRSLGNKRQQEQVQETAALQSRKQAAAMARAAAAAAAAAEQPHADASASSAPVKPPSAVKIAMLVRSAAARPQVFRSRLCANLRKASRYHLSPRSMPICCTLAWLA